MNRLPTTKEYAPSGMWDTPEKVKTIGECSDLLRALRDTGAITRWQWLILKDWLFNVRSPAELQRIRAYALNKARRLGL